MMMMMMMTMTIDEYMQALLTPPLSKQNMNVPQWDYTVVSITRFGTAVQWQVISAMDIQCHERHHTLLIICPSPNLTQSHRKRSLVQ